MKVQLIYNRKVSVCCILKRCYRYFKTTISWGLPSANYRRVVMHTVNSDRVMKK